MDSVDLIVFDIPDDREITVSQRELQFESYIKKNVLPYIQLRSMFEITDERRYIPKSNLENVLLQYLCQYFIPVLDKNGYNVFFESVLDNKGLVLIGDHKVGDLVIPQKISIYYLNYQIYKSCRKYKNHFAGYTCKIDVGVPICPKNITFKQKIDIFMHYMEYYMNFYARSYNCDKTDFKAASNKFPILNVSKYYNDEIVTILGQYWPILLKCQNKIELMYLIFNLRIQRIFMAAVLYGVQNKIFQKLLPIADEIKVKNKEEKKEKEKEDNGKTGELIRAFSDRNKKKIVALSKENICGHLKDLIELYLSNKNTLAIQKETFQIWSSKYAQRFSLNYYCKDCGSFLMKAETDEEGYIEQNYTPPDELSTSIWKELMYTVGSVIKFAPDFPIKSLINGLTQALRVVLGREEHEIFTNRSDSQETKKNILKIYVSIYVYAAIVSLVVGNKGKISFKNKQVGKSELELVQAGISLVLLTKNSIIEKVKSMTNSLIKEIFIRKAYAWTNNYIKSYKINIQETTQKVLNNPLDKLDEYFQNSKINDISTQAYKLLQSIKDWTIANPQALEDLKVLEEEKLEEKNLMKLRPMVHIIMKNDLVRKYNSFQNIDASKFYCSSGLRHKLTNYKLSNGLIVPYNEIKNRQIKDEVCGVCGAIYGKSTGVDMNNVFKELDEMDSFNRYFESRCPKGGLHELQDNNCVKCKKGELTYIQYHKLYYKIMADALNQNIRDLITEKTEYHEDKVLEKWNQSTEMLNNFSKINKTKMNILQNIGAIENCKYEDVLLGKINPSKDTTSISTRIYKLKNYNLYLIRNYNMFVNMDSVAFIPERFKNIKSDKQNEKIGLDFIKIDGLISLNPPEIYVNWLLENLFKMLMEIHKINPRLCEIFFNDILTQEKELADQQVIVANVGDDSDNESVSSNSDSESGTEAEDNGFDDFDVENEADVWELE